MTARFYLTVPFAQKDEAKGLGGRWDPARKRWYVPDGVDRGLFERWVSEEPDSQQSSSATPAGQRAGAQNRKQASAGVVIPSSDPNFVPYPGEIPPWE